MRPHGLVEPLRGGVDCDRLRRVHFFRCLVLAMVFELVSRQLITVDALFVSFRLHFAQDGKWDELGK